MRKEIGKINGCSIILEHEHKHSDVSKCSIDLAARWLMIWLEKGMPLPLYEIFKKNLKDKNVDNQTRKVV